MTFVSSVELKMITKNVTSVPIDNQTSYTKLSENVVQICLVLLPPPPE